MKNSPIFSAFIFLLALTLGASRVCACVHSPGNSHSAHSADVSLHHGEETAHAHGGDRGHGQDAPADHACPHCDVNESVASQAGADGLLAIATTGGTDKPLFTASIGQSNASVYAVDWQPRAFWLHPPPPTPVSLKIRLLN